MQINLILRQPLRIHEKPGLQDAATYRPPRLVHHNALGSQGTCMLRSLPLMKEFLKAQSGEKRIDTSSVKNRTSLQKKDSKLKIGKGW